MELLVPPDVSAQEKAPLKIRGVLIVVAIGLILGLLKTLGHLGEWIRPFRDAATWERLTIPGSSFYHPYWKTYLVFGLISASVTLLLTVVATVLFFRRHRFFPTFVVVIIPLTFALMLVSYFLESLVPAIVASTEYRTQMEYLIVRFITLHIWIPYFLVSDRVKRTFVR